MLTRNEALNLIEIALRHSTADQTEVVLQATEHGLTRLANTNLHHHVSTVNLEARVRAVVGKRIGVAVSNRLTTGGLTALVDQAIAIAKVSEANPEFVSLPSVDTEMPGGLAGAVPTPVPDLGPDAFTPERRAEAASALVTTAIGNGVSGAGHVSTTLTALAVGNSLGVRAYHQWPETSVMAIMTKDGASGYAGWAGTALADAPVAQVAGRACGKCLAAKDTVTVPAGAYTVILEPTAVAEMLTMLALTGLSATAYQEERSFMSGQLEQTLVGENVTLRDDAYHPGMMTIPFDYEGVPKRTVSFFEHGVARDVVYDSLTAHKAKRESTGHALPAPNALGPLPLHLVLDHGGMTTERLIGEVERGILVTRFHYVNVVHPKESIITGTTRDGTFLIEHGSLTRSVSNLRFTQSILAALCQVTGISDTHTLVNQEGIYCLVPWLRIDGFAFTS